MLWGLRAWWLQERKKGLLEESVLKRPDCPEGRMCELQRDYINHIIAPVESTMPSAEENVYPTEEAGLERAQAAEPERAQVPESQSEPHDSPRTERHDLQSPNEGNAATVIDHIDNNVKDIASPLPQVSTGAIASLASDGDVSPSFSQSQDARDEVDAML
ncbi:hypothetical protein PHLCEN_2v5592 [Hermanssonia centrifuga]|uniref:Uncharacterized protein n=1 Tax=Hermanssonia centrifuga TaxID=98765 RepID=A0A2R6P210_9APHY|nr:hypothetical protein PHLCEN_2v5592 [Hermanssonia centrifuga]